VLLGQPNNGLILTTFANQWDDACRRVETWIHGQS
jgi:hypothetical protein